jgi:hypothetical protein
MGHLEYFRLGLQCTSDGLVVCELLAELVDELPDSEQVAVVSAFGPDLHLDRRRRRSSPDFRFARLVAAASLSGLSGSVTRILCLTRENKRMQHAGRWE